MPDWVPPSLRLCSSFARNLVETNIWSEVALKQMAHIVSSLDQPSNYKDSQTRVDRQRQNDLLAKSTTLYVRTW